MVCHSYLPHFQRDFQQKNVFRYDSGICVIMTKRLQRTARFSAALRSWSPWKPDSDIVLHSLEHRDLGAFCA